MSRGRYVLGALLLAALVALMAPFWLVAVHLATEPSARAVLAERPFLGVQLALGLVGLLWIFGWPLARIVGRAFLRRRVTIDGGLVRSEGLGWLGQSVWSEPLARYAGVTHRVRTSLSGVRHDLVLVHPRPSRSVVLLSAPQIPREAAETAARLFTLAEIPSREAASFSSQRGYLRSAKPQSRLAAASS